MKSVLFDFKQVIDLHEEYNQVIRFQIHEIFFEEVQEQYGKKF